jgi:hypothetical protein
MALPTGSAPFPGEPILPERLFPRRGPEDSHRASGGRNRGEPLARQRSAGGCGHHVAYFLYAPLGRLLCCRQGYVIARTGKCRCAEGEGEHDAHASNRPAAHTTEPALCFHTLILIPFQIFASLFGATFRTKNRHFRPRTPTGESGPKAGINLPKENVPIAGG